MCSHFLFTLVRATNNKGSSMSPSTIHEGTSLLLAFPFDSSIIMNVFKTLTPKVLGRCDHEFLSGVGIRKETGIPKK